MLDRYREMEVGTASPGLLVLKLYERAIRDADEARAHLEAGRVAERAQAIGHALAIVSELQAALDLEAGGEVAANLDALYAFVSERFVDANLRGETAPLEEALGVLTTLHEGWRGAVLGEAAP